MSKVLEAVIADLKAREAKGIETYGTTLDRQDLSVNDYLQHLYEELADALMYTKKIQIDRQLLIENLSAANLILGSLENIDEKLYDNGEDIVIARQAAVTMITNASKYLK